MGVSRHRDCRAGELCEAAGCAPSLQSMLGPGGVTDKNLMQYLGILEQRAYEIIQASLRPWGAATAPLPVKQRKPVHGWPGLC